MMYYLNKILMLFYKIIKKFIKFIYNIVVILMLILKLNFSYIKKFNFKDKKSLFIKYYTTFKKLIIFSTFYTNFKIKNYKLYLLSIRKSNILKRYRASDVINPKFRYLLNTFDDKKRFRVFESMNPKFRYLLKIINERVYFNLINSRNYLFLNSILKTILRKCAQYFFNKKKTFFFQENILLYLF